jgi:peptidoglycan/LPS O-acetylase OafA/YrhL
MNDTLDNPALPDACGYACGVLIGYGVLMIPFVVIVFLDPILGLFAIAVLITPALVIGTIGALLLHRLLRAERRQWVHILGAGVIGAVLTTVFAWLTVPGMDLDVALVLAVPVAIASIIGRASIAPTSAKRIHAERPPDPLWDVR